MAKRKVISISIDEETLRDLDEMCEELSIGRSTYLRMLIKGVNRGYLLRKDPADIALDFASSLVHERETENWE